MSFSRPFVLLIAVTAALWQYGDSCKRQKYAETYTDEHYTKLLTIETGYYHELSAQGYAQPKKTSTRAAIDEIYKHLLCSYVHHCRHYMNLIRPLWTESGVASLRGLLVNYESSVWNFGDKVIDMLNVMYNFGKIDSVDPLWLVYMYASSLVYLNKNDRAKRSRLLRDHDTVYDKLGTFIEQHCNIPNNDNVYDDRYVDSCYRRSPSIKDSMAQLNEIIHDRISKITETITIDDCKSYLEIDHLLMGPVFDDFHILYKLLKDFAEIIDVSERQNTTRLIENTCSRNFNVESIKSLTNDIAKCYDIFANVIKYVMFYITWKYVLEVRYYLPDSANPLNEECKKWDKPETAIHWINSYSSKMLGYFNEIIRFFHLKQDEDLEFIARLFDASSESMLSDVEKNKELENTVMEHLSEINSKNFNLNQNNFTTDKFTKKYFSNRWSILQRNNSFCGIDKLKLNQSDDFESRFSFAVLRKVVKQSFKVIDFQVIASFKRFLNTNVLY